MSDQFKFLTIYISCVFLWTVSYKIIGTETFRPFQYLSTTILSLSLGYFILKYAKRSNIFLKKMSSHDALIHFLGIYFLIFAISFFSGSRAIKNSFWMFALDSLAFLSFFCISILLNTNFEKSLNLFLKIFTTITVVTSTISLIQMLGLLRFKIGNLNLDLSANFTDRLHGLFGEPNSLGASCAIGIICCVGLSHIDKSKHIRKFALLLLPFYSICLLLAASKNAILALGICLLFFFFKNLKQKKIFIPFLLLFVLTFLFKEPIGIILRVTTELSSYSTRIEAWEKGFTILNSSKLLKLLFGMGGGYFENNFGGAFNSILRISVDYGLITLLWILYAISIILKNIYHNVNELNYRICGTLLLFALTFSLFQDIYLREFFNITNYTFVTIIGILLIPPSTTEFKS